MPIRNGTGGRSENMSADASIRGLRIDTSIDRIGARAHSATLAKRR